MAGYTQVFGGTSIYPSDTSYLSLNLIADIQLNWPVEQQVGGNLIVADIMDLTAAAPGLNVDLPDARQASTGFTALFNNVGAQTVTIRSATGGTLVSLASGTVWQLYLTDNSTEAGTWRVFQYGASVSVTNAAALAGSGLKAIGSTLNQSMPVTSTAVTPTTILDSDRAKVMMWTGGVGGFTLPDPGTVGSDWYVNIRNSGSGDLTLTPSSGLINAGATLVVSSGGSAIVFTDGANYYSIGSGAGSSGGGSGFDFLSIDVAGSGNFALAGAQLNRIGYKFTGVLTGTRNIVVPGAIQEYWVDNSTTGAFSLFVKTGAQVPGVEVLQNNRAILYCDGTNVVAAESATVSFPIPVAQGGTGAVTAGAARTNLGATAVGSSLFTAASAALARAAITAADSGLTLTAGLGLTGGGDLTANRSFAVSMLGIQNLADPGADRIMFWDDSAGFTTWLSLSAGLSITGTTLSPVPGSDNVGYLNIPQNSQSGNYTCVLADAGKHIYHPLGAGAGDVYTIPSNASVAYPIGTTLTFINGDTTNSVSIAITTDTLRLAGTTTTGSRTLGICGMATAVKVTSTVWIISGAGLT